MTACYTKTAPKKEGYYWINNKEGEHQDMARFRFDEYRKVIAMTTTFGMFSWSSLAGFGYTRSVKEVVP